MPRYVYKLTNGRASDIRFLPDGEDLAADEIEGEADVLPSVQELSTSPAPPGWYPI
jgi:hypothetical protein